MILANLGDVVIQRYEDLRGYLFKIARDCIGSYLVPVSLRCSTDWFDTELEGAFDTGVFFQTVGFSLVNCPGYLFTVYPLVESIENSCSCRLLEVHEELDMDRAFFFTLFELSTGVNSL